MLHADFPQVILKPVRQVIEQERIMTPLAAPLGRGWTNESTDAWSDGGLGRFVFLRGVR